MAEELKVYLDHHISRDDLLYKRADDKMPHDNSKETSLSFSSPTLRVKDLYGEKPMDRVLRKPDFQRATWAWTSKECVSLLESVIKEQVIPSVIMWMSPEKHWYVLDGGHRISVILAWLRDDWGDKLPIETYKDRDLEEKIKDAAKEIRTLLTSKKIGKFADYAEAYEKYETLSAESREFEFEIDSECSKRAEFYRSVLSGSVGLPLQWVRGDYEKAEESFLKINKSGRMLTEWETKLVENRKSSFARVVMSVANITRAEHYWPDKIRDEENKSQIRHNVAEILEGINKLYKVLFEPAPDSTFSRLQQPLFVEPRAEPDKKPAWLAELFTIIEGGKGQEPQTEKLLKKDQSASSLDITRNGLRLVNESLEIFDHLVGNSSQPKSLALVPALFFYTENGTHVRSLLYGFLYWLFVRNDNQITLTRKKLFSAHRAAFEEVLLEKKKEIVGTFSRKVGSGSEVTGQTAKYFDELMRLLIKHHDEIKSDAFKKDYAEQFGNMKKDETASVGNKSRLFSEGQKAAITFRSHLETLPRCPICGGFLDLRAGKQFDHKKEWSKNGETEIENGRPAHPFCNNQRTIIESIQSGQLEVELPTLFPLKTQAEQLSFLDFENL